MNQDQFWDVRGNNNQGQGMNYNQQDISAQLGGLNLGDPYMYLVREF